MEKGKNRLVVADAGWAETTPEWLMEEVKTERLMGGMSDVIRKGKEEVGDAEVCVYLYTASLKAPMGHELTQAYLYLCTKLMKRRGVAVPEGVSVEKLSNDEQRELTELKQKLWKKRGGKIKSPLFDALAMLKKKTAKRGN